MPLEIFWTSLIVLDVLIVGFLISGQRRLGLIFAAMVMTADVAENSYALLVLAIPSFALPLLLQTAFFGFILGSIGFLLPSGTLDHCVSPRRCDRLS